MSIIGSRWIDLVAEVGPGFAAAAAKRGESDAFVADDYATLKQRKVFSAMVPTEFGGGGARHSEIGALIRALAQYSPSTALALSMHQHLLAAALHNHRKGRPGQKLLEAVGAKELVLISTGAGDWLASNGNAVKVDGGFRVSATKYFASGSPAGDLLVTSCAYDDPKEGPQVIHFPLPTKSEGVTVNQDWKAMGMRGTGSGSVVIKDAFVPEAAISVRRPRAKYHGVWNVILVCAMPLIMAAYLGTAEAAVERALAEGKKKPHAAMPQLFGELENLLTSARLGYESMMALANDLDFEASNELTSKILVRKTLVANACIATCAKAMEAVGGSSFQRAAGIEGLLRDVYGAQFHPLPERKQQDFTGRLALGLDPIV